MTVTVTENGVNVRNVPTTTNNKPVGVVNAGDKLTVLDDAQPWKTIAEGPYAGKFVYTAYVEKI